MKTLAFSILLGNSALAAGLLLTSGPAWAQDAVARGASPLAMDEPAEQPLQPIDLQRIGAFERNRVYHSSEDDGTPQVRGATYKARFGVEGASYAPYLGSQAPRNFPVLFRIASVSVGGEPLAFDAGVAAQCSGDVIRYERGALTEIYDIAVESIEQSFVIAALPARGELVFRIATESELAGRELPEQSDPSAARLEFANDLGAVRYGRATAVDARGASIAAPTSFTEQGIEIRVPADFVARARFPLVVDPVISTFSIDSNPPHAVSPDCAFDLTNNCWLVVHEESFSVTDHDVVWRRIASLSGQSLGSGYVDAILSDYWANPACANNNAMDRFFVVAEVTNPANQLERIMGRTIQASNGALGTTLNLGAEDPLVDLMNPDVGGDPYGSLPAYFCVVWQKNFGPGDHDIYYRMVDPAGSLATPIRVVDITGQTFDQFPSISKSNDASTWNVVWQRSGSGTFLDIRGARIDWFGTMIAPSFSIDSTTAETGLPAASTCLNGTNRWVVAYGHKPDPTVIDDWDIVLKLLDGTTVLDEMNLTESELLALGLPDVHANQTFPDVDSDGDSFAVAYKEQLQGSVDRDVYVATVAMVGSELELSEARRTIAASAAHEENPSIASTEGAGLPWRLELVVFGKTTPSSPTLGDIAGALYDNGLYASFCHPTYDGVPSCPCGNDPSAYGRGCNNSAATGGAQIIAFGISSVGSDSLVLGMLYAKPNALSIFNQGNAVLASAVPFGQGLRCAGGSIKRLYTKTASADGVAAAPVAGDASVHARSAALGDTIVPGTTRAYYVYYRDPVVLGGCAPGTTFNTTQTLQAIWIQ